MFLRCFSTSTQWHHKNDLTLCKTEILLSRSQVCSYGALLAQALPRDVHSTPFYYARPQSLPLSYPERSAAAHNSSMVTSGISSMGVFSINGPGPTPPSLLTGWVTARADLVNLVFHTVTMGCQAPKKGQNKCHKSHIYRMLHKLRCQ